METKEIEIDEKEYLLNSAEHLFRRIKGFLSTHPEILSETCRWCDRDRTCAEGVDMSAEQLMKAIELFKKANKNQSLNGKNAKRIFGSKK